MVAAVPLTCCWSRRFLPGGSQAYKLGRSVVFAGFEANEKPTRGNDKARLLTGLLAFAVGAASAWIGPLCVYAQAVAIVYNFRRLSIIVRASVQYLANPCSFVANARAIMRTGGF